jgi:hypothetical protein
VNLLDIIKRNALTINRLVLLAAIRQPNVANAAFGLEVF